MSESDLVLCLLAPDLSGLWESNVMTCVRAPLNHSRQACIKIYIVIFMNVAPDYLRLLESFVV